MGKFISPAGIILFMTAVLFDLTGIIINLCALDDLGIIDLIAGIFITGLMYVTSGGKGEIAMTKKSKKALTEKGTKILKKGAKSPMGKIFKRAGLAFIGEIVPYIGAFPFWTIAVFFHLKSKD